MSAEGRKPQQTGVVYGQKVRSPNCSPFQTKVSALIARARQIRKEPLRTLAHLMDEGWLQESWRRLRKGASFGIDAVSAQDYATQTPRLLSRLAFA